MDDKASSFFCLAKGLKKGEERSSLYLHRILILRDTVTIQVKHTLVVVAAETKHILILLSLATNLLRHYIAWPKNLRIIILGIGIDTMWSFFDVWRIPVSWERLTILLVRLWYINDQRRHMWTQAYRSISGKEDIH